MGSPYGSSPEGTAAHIPDNGKAERFIQTLIREWAYAIPFHSSDTRPADLTRWLDWYNRLRPHASLDKRSPVQALAATT